MQTMTRMNFLHPPFDNPKIRQAVMTAMSQEDYMRAIVGDDDSLFDRGLDSFGSVQLMLALEERFGIEFPDEFLTRKSFASIAAIRETVATVLHPQAT